MDEDELQQSRGHDPPPDLVTEKLYNSNTDNTTTKNDDDYYDSIDSDPTIYAVPLEKDPYNIIAIYGFTLSSVLAFVILSLKGAAVIFLYYDILEGASNRPGNRFDIPPIVDWPVRGCQFISIPLTIVAHTDATIALYWLSIKYNKPQPVHLFPHATKLSWAISLWWRLITGLLLAFASFVAINRSTTIRQLFLSIQGILLIGLMDKVLFWLGEFGFLGQQLQIAIVHLKKARMLLNYVNRNQNNVNTNGIESSETATMTSTTMTTRRRRSPRRHLKSILLAIMVLAGWMGWGTFFFFQTSGRILARSSCTQLNIQMKDDWGQPLQVPIFVNVNVTTVTVDDENETNGGMIKATTTAKEVKLNRFYFSWLSGSYVIGEAQRTYSNVFQTWELINERLVYYQVLDTTLSGNSGGNTITTSGGDNKDGDSNRDRPPYDPRRGRFWYCRPDDVEIGQWVFTIDPLTPQLRRPREVNDCDGWLLRSQPTEALRLEDVDPDSWMVWTAGDGEVEEADGMEIKCEECESSLDCHYNGFCNSSGSGSSSDDDGEVEDASDKISRFCTCEPDYTGPYCDIPLSCQSFTLVFEEDTTFLDPSYTFFQIKLDGTKSDASTTRSELLKISGHPVYVELESRFESISDAAAASNNNVRLRYFFYAANRWYIGVNNARAFKTDLLLRTDIHSFWDQNHLEVVEAGTHPTTTKENDSVFGNDWVYLLGDDGPQDFDMRLRCEDFVPAITCDSFFLPENEELGCPLEFSSTPLPAGMVGEEAFDGNFETNAISDNPLLVFSYPLNPTAASVTLVGYTVHPAMHDFACRDPQSWTISGCMENGICSPLDTQTNQFFGSRTMPNRYLLQTPYPEGAYTSFLLDFTNSGICGDPVQVAEIQLYGYYNCGNNGGDGSPFISYELGCSFDMTGLLIVDDEATNALLDNDVETSVELEKENENLPVELVFQLNHQATIAAYSIATTEGPDSCSSPKSWTLFVCRCNDFCIPVDTQTEVSLTANTLHPFVLDESKIGTEEILVESLRLVVTSNGSGNDDCGLILSEFRLHGLSIGAAEECDVQIIPAPTPFPTPGLSAESTPAFTFDSTMDAFNAQEESLII